MKSLKIQLAFLTIILCFSSCKENNVSKDAFSSKEMLIRIAELEIYPEYIEEYKEILKEEAEASVRVEPGVVSIFPMYQTENPNQIRILKSIRVSYGSTAFSILKSQYPENGKISEINRYESN